MKGVLRMHKLEKERLEAINKIIKEFGKRIETKSSVCEADARLMEHIWRDIYDRMRGYYAGLIWQLQNITDETNIPKVERLDYEVKCFREIVDFVSEKHLDSINDLTKFRRPDEECIRAAL